MLKTVSTARGRLAAAILIAVQTVPSAVLACPACKDALAGDPVGMALSWTTLLLIAVPMALFGMIGGWVFYLYWRAAPQSAEQPGPPARGWPLWTEKESET